MLSALLEKRLKSEKKTRRQLQRRLSSCNHGNDDATAGHACQGVMMELRCNSGDDDDDDGGGGGGGAVSTASDMPCTSAYQLTTGLSLCSLSPYLSFSLSGGLLGDMSP